MNYRNTLFSCNRHRKHSGYRATAAQNTAARSGCFRGCFTLVLLAKFFSFRQHNDFYHYLYMYMYRYSLVSCCTPPFVLHSCNCLLCLRMPVPKVGSFFGNVNHHRSITGASFCFSPRKEHSDDILQ